MERSAGKVLRKSVFHEKQTQAGYHQRELLRIVRSLLENRGIHKILME